MKEPNDQDMVAASQASATGATLTEVRERWYSAKPSDRLKMFQQLSLDDSEELFEELDAGDRSELITEVPVRQQRLLLGMLEPDDIADVIQQAPSGRRAELLERLTDARRREVSALLAYAQDVAGGLMNSRYVSLRPSMTASEAITYLRLCARADQRDIYYTYVVDNDKRLIGVVSLRQLLAAEAGQKVADFMDADVVRLREDMPQEEVSRVFSQTGLLALPVVDADGRIKGIITIDDAMDVAQEEQTEDVHRMGGVEALGDRYLEVGTWEMIKKRGGWLAMLFFGEMATASAMSNYEDQIAKAVILALFVPLIISSGGNAGSQASTLVVRAMALGEVRMRDWWRVMRRELVLGLSLGCILAAIGMVRILAWQLCFSSYGEHYLLIGATVSLSLVLIVLWGSLAGSLLPFVLRRLGFDPATASTPAVATLVDVTGLIVYFTVASIVLKGTLL